MMKNGISTNRCVNCVNLLQIKKKNKLYECDYEYFQNIKKGDVKLLIPLLFECIHFERLEDD